LSCTESKDEHEDKDAELLPIPLGLLFNDNFVTLALPEQCVDVCDERDGELDAIAASLTSSGLRAAMASVQFCDDAEPTIEHIDLPGQPTAFSEIPLNSLLQFGDDDEPTIEHIDLPGQPAAFSEMPLHSLETCSIVAAAAYWDDDEATEEQVDDQASGTCVASIAWPCLTLPLDNVSLDAGDNEPTEEQLDDEAGTATLPTEALPYPVMKRACDHEALVDGEAQQPLAQPEMILTALEGSSSLAQASKESTKKEVAHAGMMRRSKTQRRIIGGVAREWSRTRLNACDPAESSWSHTPSFSTQAKEPAVFRLDSDEPQAHDTARGSSLARGYETLGVQHVFHMCDGADTLTAPSLGSRNPDTRNLSTARTRSTSALALDLGQEAAAAVALRFEKPNAWTGPQAAAAPPRSSSMGALRGLGPACDAQHAPLLRPKKLPELPRVGHAGSVAWSRRPSRTLLRQGSAGISF